ncbi:hypothetical protein [Planomonospora sp. ID82291]|uniref:hypothetical protein n=1 Tax=Planomonospora sp. ID82291 TaxID=2738136 RepID=UPI0018C43E66|nr:hypothetical protein [Planomonospora sp. ID82291]MBG0818466.1 hypothetical protein [Planomonospora sp. ID82291]
MNATTRKKTLAKGARDAHLRVKTIRDQHSTATHPRDLAAATLVYGHGYKAEAVMRLAGLTRSMWHNEIKPHLPVDPDPVDPNTCKPKLPDYTEQEALEVIKAQLKTITDLDRALEAAMQDRAEKVYALYEIALQEDPSRPKMVVQELTGFNLPLITRDVSKAEMNKSAPAEAGAPAPNGEWVPAAEVATRLGVTLNKFLKRVSAAGTAGPPTRRGRGRVTLFDLEPTLTWWTDNQHHWLSAAELADRWGVPAAAVRERLRAADSRSETPTCRAVDNRYFYEPESADAWWAGVQEREKAVSHGRDAHGRVTLGWLERRLSLTYEQVKYMARRWREAGDPVPSELDDRRIRWYEPGPFILRAIGRPELAGAPLEQAGLQAALAEALLAGGITTVDQLLTREELESVPGLSAQQIAEAQAFVGKLYQLAAVKEAAGGE